MSLQNHKNLYEDLLPVLKKYGGTIKRYDKSLKILYNLNLIRSLFDWFRSSENGLKFLCLLIISLVVLVNTYPVTSLCVIFFLASLTFYLKLRLIYLVTKFKKDFIEALFMDNGISTKVSPKEYLPIKFFNQSMEINQATSLKGEDLVQGNYDKINFMFSEVKASKGRFDKKDLFNGLYLKGELTHYLQDALDIKLKATLLNNLIFGSDEVFNTKFRKKFEIETHCDKNNLKEIFTEDLQNRLIEIKRKYGYHFDINIKNEQFIITIDGNRDYFPLSEKANITEFEIIKALTIDIYFFVEIIKWINDLYKSFDLKLDTLAQFEKKPITLNK